MTISGEPDFPIKKAALPDLCTATFPSGEARSPCATSPKALPLIRHLTAYSCQLTAYRKSAASQHSSCGFAAARLTQKEGALLGRLSAFCIKAKLGSPMQDFHLQGPAYWGLPQLRRIPVTIHISAAKPLSGPPPVRSICSPVGEHSDANPPPLCPIHPDTPPPLTRSPSPLKRGGLQSIKAALPNLCAATAIPGKAESTVFPDTRKISPLL